MNNPSILSKSFINTPIGQMIAIGNEMALYLLEFTDNRKLDRKIERLEKKTNSTIIDGKTETINSIEQELHLYFDKKLHEFKTALFTLGSPFQKCVWEELQKIPYGTTRSYSDMANRIKKPTAYRAVAQANGSNNLCVIIPCHRVINSNGELGGYSSGVSRKQWLLSHEK